MLLCFSQILCAEVQKVESLEVHCPWNSHWSCVLEWKTFQALLDAPSPFSNPILPARFIVTIPSPTLPRSNPLDNYCTWSMSFSPNFVSCVAWSNLPSSPHAGFWNSELRLHLQWLLSLAPAIWKSVTDVPWEVGPRLDIEDYGCLLSSASGNNQE